MATKKAKRAAALRKHEEFMAEVRAEGLKALQKDRERRKRENLKKWEKPHEEHSWKKIDPECPHCQKKHPARDRAAEKFENNKEIA